MLSGSETSDVSGKLSGIDPIKFHPGESEMLPELIDEPRMERVSALANFIQYPFPYNSVSTRSYP